MADLSRNGGDPTMNTNNTKGNHEGNTQEQVMCMCTLELAQDKHISKKFDAWYKNMSSIMKE